MSECLNKNGFEVSDNKFRSLQSIYNGIAIIENEIVCV